MTLLCNQDQTQPLRLTESSLMSAQTVQRWVFLLVRKPEGKPPLTFLPVYFRFRSYIIHHQKNVKGKVVMDISYFIILVLKWKEHYFKAYRCNICRCLLQIVNNSTHPLLWDNVRLKFSRPIIFKSTIFSCPIRNKPTVISGSYISPLL